MDYLRMIEEREEELKREKRPLTLESIPLLTLSEFEERGLAVEVYSEFLDEKIWLCSNTDMAKQIKGDDPTAVCYTADELIELIELDPDKDFLKKIHDTKTVFNYSKFTK